MEELRRSCKGNAQCVHDAVASGSSETGRHALEARQRFEELALVHGEAHPHPPTPRWFGPSPVLIQALFVPSGNVPPLVTGPMVIHCKVNSTVTVQFEAEDTNGDGVSYSLLYPRPPGASISSGEAQTSTAVALERREPPHRPHPHR